MGEVILVQSGYSRSHENGELLCDSVPLRVIAETYGTPTYVYSANTIRDRYNALSDALTGVLGSSKFRLHFAMKSNSNLSILGLLRGLGAGVDIVSGGELFRALKAGYTGVDVVFSGVGKTDEEITAALKAGIKSLNVESPAELEAIQRVAESLGVVAPLSFRVNPDVYVDSPHPYIKTGEHGMKFGIPDDQIVELTKRTLELPNVRLVGLAAHMGSQIAQAEPYGITAKKLLDLANEIRALGVTTLRYMDLGGGIGVTYENESPMNLIAFANAIAPYVIESGLELELEPGRFLVAESGALLAQVVYRKRSGGKDIFITDTGMNDLIRPALYEAYHAIDSVSPVENQIVADIVGPVCESGDFFALDRTVGEVEQGGYYALRGAGAYGYVMASNYNSRGRPAEVLVDGDRYGLISRRETHEDLLKLEYDTPLWNIE